MLIDRRTLIGTGATALVIAKAGNATAQSATIPKLDETLEFLESSRITALLYHHFVMAFSLAVNIVTELEIQTIGAPEALQKLPLHPSERVETRGVFRLLVEISDPNVSERRENLLSKLKSSSDPLELYREQHIQLVSRFSEATLKFGVAPDSPLGSSAVNSLTHVERIAAVEFTSNTNSSYLCRIFPFKGSWFCS